MTKYLRIANDGEIDINALHLIGASTKRSDNSKIGFFGSGLKYALAYLIRNNYNIKLYSGLTEIKITTEVQMLRDQAFNVIYIDGIRTSFTTDMGPDWKLWYAIRELYCNALDEDNGTITDTIDVEGIKDKTQIYIEINAELELIIEDFDNYFSFKRKDIICMTSISELYKSRNESITIYRKGIRCYDTNRKGIFDYNFNEIPINESRVVMYGSDILERITKTLCECNDKASINYLFSCINNKDYQENGLLWYDYQVKNFDEAWINAINNRLVIPAEASGWYLEEMNEPHIVLPINLCLQLKKFFKDRIRVVDCDNDGEEFICINIKDEKISPYQKTILKQSLTFLEDCKFPVKYDIKIVEFPNHEKIYGQAKNKTILIAQKALDAGKRKTIEVIIEEQQHIETGFNDETREFQTSIFQRFVTYMAEINCNPL